MPKTYKYIKRIYFEMELYVCTHPKSIKYYYLQRTLFFHNSVLSDSRATSSTGLKNPMANLHKGSRDFHCVPNAVVYNKVIVGAYE